MQFASVKSTQHSATRQIILQAAFDEIHARGFQGTSLSKILSSTQVTKGALYHYFPNKLALGYAVVEELIAADIYDQWVAPLIKMEDPILAMKQIIMHAGQEITNEDILYGCPLNNLAQEMTPVDEGFRFRIEGVYKLWQQGIEDAFKSGQKKGFVKNNVNVKYISTMIIATLEGCIGLAKNAQSKKVLYQCGQSLMDYLDSLKA